MRSRRWLALLLVPAALLAVSMAGRSSAGYPPMQAHPAGADWTIAFSDDSSVTYRLPAGYRLTRYGCAARPGRESGGRYIRSSLCVRRSERRPSLRDKTGPLNLNQYLQTDAYTLRGLRTERVELAGRSAVAQRALLSGGIGGMSDSPVILVQIRLSDGGWAALEGHPADDTEWSELLSIAATVQGRAVR